MVWTVGGVVWIYATILWIACTHINSLRYASINKNKYHTDHQTKAQGGVPASWRALHCTPLLLDLIWFLINLLLVYIVI